mmetsp:Transcript_41578/g.96822  ORF Transcript_41578/g.96822 Transcript_41578/m.96822 type:complete len:563 (-) Transcript_41578:60-1748(-)
MEADTSTVALLDDALQKNHAKLMETLDSWLQQLDARIATLELFDPGSGASSPRLRFHGTSHNHVSSSATKHHLQESEAMDGAIPEEEQEEQQQEELKEASEEPSHEMEASQSSYDLAKREGSRMEVYKKLHTNTMQSRRRNKYIALLCPNIDEYQDKAAALLQSTRFEMFFACILVANSIYIGVQIQLMTDDTSPSTVMAPGFLAGHILFAVLFTFELFLSLFAFGVKGFLCGSHWGWAWLDVLVVCSAWLELAFDLDQTMNSSGTNGTNSSVRIVRVFKFTRLLQGVRSLRIVRYVSGLRILVYSMFDATKSLLWALVLLALIIYVFGLLFTSAALDHRLTTGMEDSQLSRYWGTLDVSVTTLYRSVLGGLDWGEAAGPLGTSGYVWVLIFQFYIGFVSFSILNVMTGVFCNSAIRAAEHDHTIMMQNRTQFRDMAAELFKKMDSTGFGEITINEFENLYEDEDMKAFLDSIEISASDAWTLFASLDEDGNGLVGIKEFTEGCLKLHGPARSVDLYALRQQNIKLREHLNSIEKNQRQIIQTVEQVRAGSDPRKLPRIYTV